MRLSDLARWVDPQTGMITAADGGLDNLALDTATAVQFLGPADKAELRMRFLEFAQACEIEPGLYSRLPGDRGAGSVDNAVGMILLSHQLDTNHRQDILKYAESHGWVFDVENPAQGNIDDPFSRHNYGKFGAIPPFMAVAAGRAIPLYDQIIVGAAPLLTASAAKGETSDKCLQVLINHVVEKRYALCDLGILVWKKMMKNKYPRGQRELYEIYWGAEHPFARESSEEF